MTDREMLLFAYGALKAKAETEADEFIVSMIERHLAVQVSIEKAEKLLDNEQGE